MCVNTDAVLACHWCCVCKYCYGVVCAWSIIGGAIKLIIIIKASSWNFWFLKTNRNLGIFKIKLHRLMFTLFPHCSLLECRILKGEAKFTSTVTNSYFHHIGSVPHLCHKNLFMAAEMLLVIVDSLVIF